MKDDSQCKDILRHFEAGGSLIQPEATIKYGIGRLAARIVDLEKLGYEIDHKPERYLKANGKTAILTRYSMRREPNG